MSAGLEPETHSDSISESKPESVATGLALGAKWLGRYGVETELVASGGGVVFGGTRLADALPVRFRRLVGAADSEVRQRVWKILANPPISGIPTLLDSVVEDGGRVEVWQHVEGPTLEERLATAKLVTEDVADLVRPLAEALAALHERGLGYLQLGAERVLLPDANMRHAQLTRVEMCVPLGGDGLVAVPTDPTRMPPEASGLYRLTADEGLKAWDWWTLGRLIQELWLGRTVMAHKLGRDLPRGSELVRHHAEEMLKETDGHAVRAGGVELMTDMPVQVKTLLRGLLTSVRDARWGAREVMAWLDGKVLPERYAMLRTTVLVAFHNEMLTVAEVAQRLSSAEHWREGVALWRADGPVKGSVLDAIDRAKSGLVVEREWLAKVRELAETRAVKDWPADLRAEILASLAWMGLLGKGGLFRWHGQCPTPAVLLALLKEKDGYARVMALLSRSVISLVKQADANFAWALDTWARQIEQVQALASKHDWVKTDSTTQARLVVLALTDAAEFDRALAVARLTYRFSNVEGVQTMFGAPNPTPAMLAVLALSFENAKACGYVTHEQWRAGELERLRQRGARVVDALAAVRLSDALGQGFPIFGGEPAWRVGAAFLAGLTALFWPGLVGLVVAATLLVALGVGRRLMRPMVAEHCGLEVEGWRWAGVRTAFLKRARAALDGSTPPPARRLERVLKDLNRDIGRLGIEPPPALVLARPMDERIRVMAWGSWLVVGLMLFNVSWQGLRPDWSAHWAAGVWRTELLGWAERLGWVEPAEPVVELVKIQWPHKQTVDARGVTYENAGVGNSAQIAVAEAFAAEILRLYLPETISGLVAVSVPQPDGRIGALMLIDPASGKLVDTTVRQMPYIPLRGTWIKLGEHDAVFLNSP